MSDFNEIKKEINDAKIKNVYLKPDGTEKYSHISDYHSVRFYFEQKTLPSGKNCNRKATPKKAKEIIKLIEDNLHNVTDYAKILHNNLVAKGEQGIVKKEFIVNDHYLKNV